VRQHAPLYGICLSYRDHLLFALVSSLTCQKPETKSGLLFLHRLLSLSACPITSRPRKIHMDVGSIPPDTRYSREKRTNSKFRSRPNLALDGPFESLDLLFWSSNRNVKAPIACLPHAFLRRRGLTVSKQTDRRELARPIAEPECLSNLVIRHSNRASRRLAFSVGGCRCSWSALRWHRNEAECVSPPEVDEMPQSTIKRVSGAIIANMSPVADSPVTVPDREAEE